MFRANTRLDLSVMLVQPVQLYPRLQSELEFRAEVHDIFTGKRTAIFPLRPFDQQQLADVFHMGLVDVIQLALEDTVQRLEEHLKDQYTDACVSGWSPFR